VDTKSINQAKVWNAVYANSFVKFG
jgi:hypothetical protein